MTRTVHRTLLPLLAAVALAGCARNEPRPMSAEPATAHPPAEAPAAPAPPPAAEPTPSGPAKLGQPAPDFELPSLGGSTVKLSSYRGKIVVLEWFNPDCPFVKQAHRRDGQLKGLAAKYRDQNVVWLAINSGAPGRQGHGRDANETGKQRFAIDYPILLDESGNIGRAYGAQRTPHIFVIDQRGTLVYRGALDNTRGGDVEDADPFVNYAVAAIADVQAGRSVQQPQTEPYGCTVKYAN